MSHISGSTIVTGSTIWGNVTNNNVSSDSITPDMWEEMFTLAARHGKSGEVKKLLELQTLLTSSKGREAKSTWESVRSFFSVFVQRSANVAQIIGTIDTLTR